jgi:hypothetical protein
MSIHDGRPEWRTQETHNKYVAEKSKLGPNAPCPLCLRNDGTEYNFWKLIANDFPYDRVTSKHDMLVLKRHAGFDDASIEEQAELQQILNSEATVGYNFILQSMPKTMSIPEHLHYHLVVTKDLG